MWTSTGRSCASSAKGDRYLLAHLDAEAIKAVGNYMRRARMTHSQARPQWLWLGKFGRYTLSGIGQMVRDRGAALHGPGRPVPDRAPSRQDRVLRGHKR